MKSDISPCPDDDETVRRADCRHLDFLVDGSVGSVFFDPPFLPVGPKQAGIIAERFSGFSSLEEMYAMYKDSLKEFQRILGKKGVVIWKCQDIVNHDRQRMIHVWIINEAIAMGYEVLDLFVLVRKGRMTSGRWKTQVHARKNHCYYLVLRKK